MFDRERAVVANFLKHLQAAGLPVEEWSTVKNLATEPEKKTEEKQK